MRSREEASACAVCASSSSCRRRPRWPHAAAPTLPKGIPNILRALRARRRWHGRDDRRPHGRAASPTATTRGSSLAPASNEKLFTTVAALSTLRPGFRYETTLNGAGARNGANLRRRRLPGRVAATRPSRPGGSTRSPSACGRAACATSPGASSATSRSSTACASGRSGRRRSTAPSRPRCRGSRVNRNTAPNGHMLPYPALSAARLMRKALIRTGSRVGGIAATGKVAFGSPGAGSVASRPLWRILRSMDRFSGQLHRRDGDQGRRRPRRRLRAAPRRVSRSPATVLQQTIGDDASELHLVDGSGLSSANRATASALAELLARTVDDPTSGRRCARRSPVAGVNGDIRAIARRRGPGAREDRDPRWRLVAVGLRDDADAARASRSRS